MLLKPEERRRRDFWRWPLGGGEGCVRTDQSREAYRRAAPLPPSVAAATHQPSCGEPGPTVLSVRSAARSRTIQAHLDFRLERSNQVSPSVQHERNGPLLPSIHPPPESLDLLPGRPTAPADDHALRPAMTSIVFGGVTGDSEELICPLGRGERARVWEGVPEAKKGIERRRGAESEREAGRER